MDWFKHKPSYLFVSQPIIQQRRHHIMEREARCIVYSVLQVIYANAISMISSCVNLQCISGLSLLSTNIACVATVEVDLTVAPHQS